MQSNTKQILALTVAVIVISFSVTYIVLSIITPEQNIVYSTAVPTQEDLKSMGYQIGDVVIATTYTNDNGSITTEYKLQNNYS